MDNCKEHEGDKYSEVYTASYECYPGGHTLKFTTMYNRTNKNWVLRYCKDLGCTIKFYDKLDEGESSFEDYKRIVEKDIREKIKEVLGWGGF